MDQESSPHAGVTDLSVPLDGVAYILSGWSGKGSLFQTLGGVDDPEDMEREWDETAIRRRAGRILLEHVRADLAHWPKSAEAWRPHMPVTSSAQTLVSRVPRGRVDWRETSRRFGWPARSYVTRLRQREIADVTVTTLAWTVDALDHLVGEARNLKAVEDVEAEIDHPLVAAREALTLTTVPELLPRPDRHDLESLRSSGKPWSDVEPVTSKIVRSETDLLWFAMQLLAPDPDFRWRLFHLSVLGHTLLALRAQGASIKWLAPMGAGGSGPNFVASFPDGTTVDVWFEASGAHAYYGAGTSPYRATVRPVKGTDAAIGADLGLFIPRRQHALLFECKYSSSGPYIGRNGFHQAAGYALNEQALWTRLWSYVVGPEEKVEGGSRVSIPGTDSHIALGVTAVPGVPSLIADFLDATI